MEFLRDVSIATAERIKSEVEPGNKNLIGGPDGAIIVLSMLALASNNPLIERFGFAGSMVESFTGGQLARAAGSAIEVTRRWYLER